MFYADRRSIVLNGFADCLIVGFIATGKKQVQGAPFSRMRKEVEIVNKLGLHARPPALFVRYVITFKSTITICKGEENFSAASLLEVLTANLNCGDRVVPEAIGPDEQEALNELEALLLRFRDEEGGAQGN